MNLESVSVSLSHFSEDKQEKEINLLQANVNVVIILIEGSLQQCRKIDKTNNFVKIYTNTKFYQVK